MKLQKVASDCWGTWDEVSKAVKHAYDIGMIEQCKAVKYYTCSKGYCAAIFDKEDIMNNQFYGDCYVPLKPNN